MPVQCTCRACGKAFAVKPSMIDNGRGRYCSLACKGTSQRHIIDRACEQCGGPISDSRHRFCSYACHHASMRTVPPPGPCAYCGQSVGQSKKREPKKFCSLTCSNAARRVIPPTTCETCGAPMTGGKPSRPRRFCSYACSTVPTIPIEQRFWPKVDKDGPIMYPDLGPCWIWTAAKDGNGYGKIGRGRAGTGAAGAHQVSWEIHQGVVSDGLFVLHHCDNPPCVRPDHLFIGTHDDNMADMAAKGRSGGGPHNAVVTEQQVREMRLRYAAGEKVRALATEYNIAYWVVWYAVRRKTWKHVD